MAIGVCLLSMLTLPAQAAHTEEETDVFFAQLWRETADFELKLLAEKDSKAAARRAFDDKARADRAAFTQTLDLSPAAQRGQLLDNYNASARQAKLDFEKSLTALPPNDLEKTLADFDKNSTRDTQAQAQRARIIVDAQNRRTEKQSEFRLNKLNRIRDFNES